VTFVLNFAQVPLPFVLNLGRTLAPRGARRVHAKTPNPALLKRQATLQICCRARGEHPRIAIIFRGTGKKIPQVERLALDQLTREEGIDV